MLCYDFAQYQVHYSTLRLTKTDKKYNKNK